MDEGRLIGSLFITGMIGIFVMGARFIIRETLSKAYCVCHHEFNEHHVLPHGMKPETFDIPAGEPCKKCPCKGYKRNDKDARNTPPIKFF